MRKYMYVSFLCACNPATSGGGPSGPPPTTTPSPSASTGTVSIQLTEWESDRQCWALREASLPAQYWQSYLDDECSIAVDTGGPQWYTSGTADGDCLAWPTHTAAGCSAISDPWLVGCDQVPGCCDQADPGEAGMCVPSTWEP